MVGSWAKGLRQASIGVHTEDRLTMLFIPDRHRFFPSRLFHSGSFSVEPEHRQAVVITSASAMFAYSRRIPDDLNRGPNGVRSGMATSGRPKGDKGH
jgi:hypothetical protein